MALLIKICEPGEVEAVFDVEQRHINGFLTIGRSMSGIPNHVSLRTAGQEISRQHCTIAHADDPAGLMIRHGAATAHGEWRHPSSSLPTYVDGQQIGADRWYDLPLNAEIHIGPPAMGLLLIPHLPPEEFDTIGDDATAAADDVQVWRAASWDSQDKGVCLFVRRGKTWAMKRCDSVAEEAFGAEPGELQDTSIEPAISMLILGVGVATFCHNASIAQNQDLSQPGEYKSRWDKFVRISLVRRARGDYLLGYVEPKPRPAPVVQRTAAAELVNFARAHTARFCLACAVAIAPLALVAYIISQVL